MLPPPFKENLPSPGRPNGPRMDLDQEEGEGWGMESLAVVNNLPEAFASWQKESPHGT